MLVAVVNLVNQLQPLQGALRDAAVNFDTISLRETFFCKSVVSDRSFKVIEGH